MSFSPNRRRLLKAAPAIALPASIAACGRSEELPLPPDVPISNFNADSTAEEVTAGLDLSGQTAVVTGCNSGIGYETMRVLALRGAHVFGTGRTLEKADKACATVEGRTTPLALELTEPDTIIAAAKQIREQSPALDMLVCNAGIMELPELQQVYGIEKQFFVNHLGHFILINHLLDHVRAAGQGRIVIVSSGQAIRGAPEQGIQFDNLSGEIGYDPALAYGQSKLANVLTAVELTRRLAGTPVTANALRPGVIPTNLGRHMPIWKTWMLETLGKPFTKTVEQGAATSCYVATAPALSETSGYFFNHCNPHRPGGHTENTEMAKELWSVSTRLTSRWLPAADEPAISI